MNFWRPAGDRRFRALSIGEPFFFKTHHPDNKVVGGGFFSGFASLTISEAWQIYGEANGASTLDEMRARVGRYRRAPGVVRGVYSHRCAITGDKIRPVLQAAHIRPLTQGGEHRVDNGLLLRSDVHTLFDAGYLAVAPNCSLVVSPRLRGEFGNGEEFTGARHQESPWRFRRAGSIGRPASFSNGISTTSSCGTDQQPPAGLPAPSPATPLANVAHFGDAQVTGSLRLPLVS